MHADICQCGRPITNLSESYHLPIISFYRLKFVRLLQPGIWIMFRSLLWFKLMITKPSQIVIIGVLITIRLGFVIIYWVLITIRLGFVIIYLNQSSEQNMILSINYQLSAHFYIFKYTSHHNKVVNDGIQSKMKSYTES
jgi:hypothetical protein